MKAISRSAFLGLVLCLALAWPSLTGTATAAEAPPELYRFPQLGAGVLGGQMHLPFGVAANRQDGSVYVAEHGNNRITQYGFEGEFVRTWGWGVVRSGPNNKPSNEKQEVTVSAAKGAFRLVFRNSFSQIENSGSYLQPTDALPYNATAAEVKAALEALETPQPGDFSVTGPAGGPWIIEFVGTLADADFSQLQISESTLKNGDDSPGAATVKTLQEGGNFELCEAADGDLCRAGQEGSSPGHIADPRGGIAVDDAGSVFVFEQSIVVGDDPVQAKIQKFSREGEFLLMMGGEVNRTTGADVCTKEDIAGGDECGYGTPGTAPGELSSMPLLPFPDVLTGADHLAVGPDGKLYVGDDERIVVYGTDGVYQGEIPVVGQVKALAIDGDGNFYLSYIGQDDVFKLTPAGLPATPASFPVESSAPAIAVDGEGNLYVVDDEAAFGSPPVDPRVAKFDSLGTQLLPTAEEVKTGKYFAQRGSFDILGLENLLCEGGIGAGTLYVSDFSGNVSGYGEDSECSSEPRPPLIVSQVVRSVGVEGAVLQARINPRKAPTTYYLEYGTEPCSTGACTQVPAPPGLALSGEGNIAQATEEIELEGLDPDTTYHYRFVAENGLLAEGGDRSFTTRRAGAGGLLDGRAWEKVSPAEKGSGQVAHQGGTHNEPLQASESGDALVYPGTAPFGDPPGAPGSNYYLSSREADSWATRNVTPPRQGGNINPPLQGFSRDLSRYLVSLEEPVLCCGATPGVENLYLVPRDGGPLQLATPAAPQLPPGDTDGYCVGLGGASADFSRVFFRAKGALTPESPVGSANLYEWSAEGGLQLVSVMPDGSPAPAVRKTHFGEAYGECGTNTSTTWRHRAVSDDGSMAVWTYGGTYEGALEPLMARGEFTETDEETGEPVETVKTVRLDAPQGLAGPGGEGKFLGAAADGSKVFFDSLQKLTPGAVAGGELYRYDFEAAEGEELSNLTPSPGAAGVQGALDVAADGKSIYFVATGALAANPGASLDPKTGAPQTAVAGKRNLYLWQEEEGVRFIARLGSVDDDVAGDSRNWTRASQSHIGTITPDGGHALLLTAEPLTGYENLAADGETRLQEAFLYDAAEHRLTCVSCNPTGAQPLGAAALTSWKGPFQAPRLLSADGQRVFFESFDALTEDDENEARDVYEFERPGKGDCTTASPAYHPNLEGCLALVSAGREGAEDSYFLDASASGDDVFFSTLDRLVGADEDELYDVYDARVGGGLPEAPPPPPGCEGEACRGPGSTPPAGPGAATGTFNGPGNSTRLHCPKGQVVRKGNCAKKKVRCPKGKVARKGRCVKKKARKAKQQNRADKRPAATRAGGNR